MANFNPTLIGILVVVVVAMVYLSVEGFYAYASYSEYLRAKYGIPAGMDTASMSASQLEARTSWDSAYGQSASQQKLYDLIRKSGNLDDIRKLMADPSAKLPKTWLTYFDDTDYTNKNCVATESGSECGYGVYGCKITGSGSDTTKTCKFEPKTGSRLNTSANTRNPEYSNLDNPGGKFLTQCDSNDFNCIRNLTFADGNYQPYTMPTNDVYSSYNNSLLNPYQTYPAGQDPSMTSPSTTGVTGTPTSVTVPKTPAEAIACMKKCIAEYGASVKNLESCSNLCSGQA
jgi:hypothetical protein